jgi:hypothetical protein
MNVANWEPGQISPQTSIAGSRVRGKSDAVPGIVPGKSANRRPSNPRFDGYRRGSYAAELVRRRYLPALVLGVAILYLATPGPTLQAMVRPVVSVRKVAPGIKHVRIVRRRPPNRIHVLRVAVRRRPSIDVALPFSGSFGFRRTSRTARRYGAVAAVNGTFTLPTGRPYGVFARNGNLMASPLMWSRAFSLADNERDFYAGHPKLSVAVQPSDDDDVLEIESVNEAVTEDRQGLHTPVGGRFYPPPHDACAVRLRRAGGLSWSPLRIGVQRPHRVDAVRCSSTPLARRNGMVLSARRGTEEAEALEELEPLDALTVGWNVGWAEALDVMGGNPLLLKDRAVISPASCGSAFCGRHPRTGIGVTARGEVLLVTVDGRQPKRSVGMTLGGFARLFRRLGATDAINLDGGGSTTMAIRGRVINRPSDRSGERRVGSVILVRRRNHPSGVTDDSGGGGAPDRAGAAAAAIADPASSGGMLDAFSRGALGGAARRLPPSLERVVRIYRSNQAAAR